MIVQSGLLLAYVTSLLMNMNLSASMNMGKKVNSMLLFKIEVYAGIHRGECISWLEGTCDENVGTKHAFPHAPALQGISKTIRRLSTISREVDQTGLSAIERYLFM